MSLINCKVEWKRNWTNLCVFCAGGDDNIIGNISDKNITFTTINTKLLVPEVTLLTEYNKNNRIPLAKDFKDQFIISVYWSEYKKNNENKNKANEYRYFLESNFAEVNKLFLLVHSNQEDDSKSHKAIRYYLPECIIRNYNVIINEKKYYD